MSKAKEFLTIVEDNDNTISGRDLLDIYYEMSPNSKGADRVERVLGEGGAWELKKVKLSDIPFDMKYVKAASSQKLIAKYLKKKGNMPPVILDTPLTDEYEIVDGFHRIAVATLRGDKYIDAYVPA